MDELIVYRPWPEPEIREALDEFKRQMYDGAGPEELAAGLHGLDFLTRRSEMSDTLREFLDAAVDEAHIRIDLMRQQEAEQRTRDENLARAYKAVDLLRRQIEAYRRRFIDGYVDPDVVRAHVRRRVEARSA